MCVIKQSKMYDSPVLIILHPHDCRQELYYYLFAVNLDTCARRCNTLDDLSSRVFVPNETEDLSPDVLIDHAYVMQM